MQAAEVMATATPCSHGPMAAERAREGPSNQNAQPKEMHSARTLSTSSEKSLGWGLVNRMRISGSTSAQEIELELQNPISVAVSFTREASKQADAHLWVHICEGNRDYRTPFSVAVRFTAGSLASSGRHLWVRICTVQCEQSCKFRMAPHGSSLLAAACMPHVHSCTALAGNNASR